MKNILTAFLACAATIAAAQNKCQLSKSVDDNGVTLTVKVSGTLNGKDVRFDRTFDVASMSREERQDLKEDILEELEENGYGMPDPVSPPKAPSPAAAPPAPPAPEVWVSREPEAAMRQDQHAKTFQNLDQPGYRKHVKFNPETGEMFLQYHFLKNNEEYIFEKTVNAGDKSERERQSIIDKFEREIELPGKGMEM